MNLFELFVKIGADTSQAEKGMKNTQKNSETLTNKIKVMSAQFEAAQKNVDKLTQEFNESVKKTGATSKETQELAKKLDDAEKEAEQAKKALDGYNSELGETETKAEKAGGGISNFASKLGKGLKTAAKVGTAAVGVASAAITALTTQAVNSFAEYEQLAGGAQKIFDQMDFSKIATDANNAYKELGLSANQYLAVINDVGATFAATMGDEAGYEAAKTGLKAISDYASGTGKNVDELSQKFTLITRSTSSYQSIADQFSGILPATSAGFLEQAQAAGILSDKYTQLTQVPIDEYQAAVSQMLQQGVADLGLANNTANEAFSTLSGSLNMTKSAWANLITGIADGNADLDMLISNLVESVSATASNLLPVVSTALNGVVGLIQNLAPQIIEMLPGLLSTVLPNLISAATSLLESVAHTIPSLLPVIFDTAIPKLLEGVKSIFSTLSSLLPSLLPEILGAAVSLVVKLAQALPKLIRPIIKNLPAAFRQLAAAIGKNLPILLNEAVILVTEVVKLLPELTTMLTDVIPDIYGAIIPALIDSLPILLNSLGILVMEIFKALPDLLISGLALSNPIGLFFMALDGVLKSYFGTGLIEMIKEFVKSAWDSLVEVFDNIVEFFVDLPENISKWLKNTTKKVKDWGKNLLSSAGDIVKNLLSTFKEKISGFTEIGKNIVAGLKKGIQGAWANLKKWFTSLFGDLTAVAKKILGIASPSKVFKKLGFWTAKGYGVGFEDEFAHVKDDMEDALNFDDASVGINASVRKVGAGVAGGAFGGTSIGNITINIDGAKYSDEQSLAEAIALKIQEMTDRRSAVYA